MTTITLTTPDTPAPAHWHDTHVLALPQREARTVPLHTLPSGAAVQRYLRLTHPGGIYTHQADSAASAARFEDFAVTTGTAPPPGGVTTGRPMKRRSSPPPVTFA